MLLAACIALAVAGIGTLAVSRSISKQHATRSWVQTPARVISSVPFREAGLIDAQAITYEYRVDGKAYQSSRYCFGIGLFSSTRGNRFRASWAAGMMPPAFVNPHDPSQAVLDNTLHGYHLMPIPLVLPFALLAVSSTIAGVRWLQRKQHKVAGGLLLSDRGNVARVELQPVSPKWGLVSGAFAMWLFMMALLTYGFDFDPPIWAVAAGASLVLIAGVVRYLWLVKVRERGEGALAVDVGRRELRLPSTLAEFHGKPTLRFDDVEASESLDAVSLGDDAKQGKWVVKIRPHGCNHTRSIAVRRTDNPVEAEDLAQWLRKQVGVASSDNANAASVKPSSAAPAS